MLFHSLFPQAGGGVGRKRRAQVMLLCNDLLWQYTLRACVMRSAVGSELWRATYCTHPLHLQIHKSWTIIQQYTLFRQLSIKQLRLKCDSVWDDRFITIAGVSLPPPLITNRSTAIITEITQISYPQFPHGMSHSTFPVLLSGHW